MWQVQFTKRADKDFSKLTPEIRKRIDKAIEEKLLTNPDKYLVGLVGELSDLYKFRVGDYRLLCSKDGQRLIIHVVKVAHRKEVYH
ncbi:MAG: type II toxin-antitoxin system RelE/ParE family toxin [Proteobacteria bacterium]|nr:type II toxin-antitoxin system RelE/ParE family toxin [Pseudomonadota bacterium]